MDRKEAIRFSLESPGRGALVHDPVLRLLHAAVINTPAEERVRGAVVTLMTFDSAPGGDSMHCSFVPYTRFNTDKVFQQMIDGRGLKRDIHRIVGTSYDPASEVILISAVTLKDGRGNLQHGRFPVSYITDLLERAGLCE